MSNLPNTVIRLTPPSLRQGYCPSSWQEFANDLVCGTFAQHKLNRGTTFYNFGNQSTYPPPPTPEPPEPSCVDFGIDWEPASFELEKYISVFVGDEFPGLNGATGLSFEADEYVRDVGSFDYFFIWNNTTIQTISFPNMVTLGTGITIRYLTALTSLLMPNLTTVLDLNAVFLRCEDCTSLTSVSLPSLVGLNDNMSFYNCSSLSSFSAQNMVVKNNKNIDFENTALDQTSVDHVLARLVANPLYKDGTVWLNGGTVSTPSAAGLADKATLLARGGALAIYTN